MDYAEFNEPNELFRYIDKMSFQEFKYRLNLCIETHNAAYKKTQTKNPWQAQIDKVLEQLYSLINE